MPSRTPYHMLMTPMPLVPVPGKAAMVLLDVQGFTTARGQGLDAEAARRGIAGELEEYYAQVEAALRNLAHVVGDARAAGLPVIHLRTAREAGLCAQFAASGLERPATAAGDGAGLGPLDAAEGEAVIARRGYGAFADTDLEARLRAGGTSTLLLAGMMANVTVALVAREAADRDFQVLVVQDACASETLAAHASMMQGLSGGAIRVVSSGDASAMIAGRVL